MNVKAGLGLKTFIIKTMSLVGRIPFLPLSTKLWLARKYRGFRFFVPPGREFIFEGYLGNLKVNVNTVYPIELEMATGSYDPISSAVIQRFVTPDAVAIDIGANVGALTLLMAKRVDNGKVIAIEPGPPICIRLRKNIDLNPLYRNRVEILELGVSNTTTELLWKEDVSVPGNGGFVETGGLPVKIDTLDNIITTLDIPGVDFIKIDVEGMEYEVIQGGLTSIASYRPVLYYETLEQFIESRGFNPFQKIHDLLNTLDYQHYCVFRKGVIQAVENLDILHSTNTLAIPREKARYFS